MGNWASSLLFANPTKYAPSTTADFDREVNRGGFEKPDRDQTFFRATTLLIVGPILPVKRSSGQTVHPHQAARAFSGAAFDRPPGPALWRRRTWGEARCPDRSVRGPVPGSLGANFQRLYIRLVGTGGLEWARTHPGLFDSPSRREPGEGVGTE